MPDTQRTTEELTTIFSDNSQGEISAQDLRDFVVSTFNKISDPAPQGAQGSQGATGNQGPAGSQGAAGSQGSQGAAGSQGPQGQRGKTIATFSSDDANGADPTYYLGTVGFLDGDYALDLGWHSYNLWQWYSSQWQSVGNIKGGQGDQGPQGDAGPQGDQGPQGDAGPQGDTGTVGNDGPQGPAGDTGPQGYQGDAGPQGYQGDVGAQGDAASMEGPQGPQGNDGATGPQGDQGPSGNNGTDGAAGPNSIDNYTATTLSGVLYGNGSTVSSDTAATLDGSGLLWVNQLNVGRSTSAGYVVIKDGSGADIISLYSDGTIVFLSLPTSDPEAAGHLWNDSGVLKVSAG